MSELLKLPVIPSAILNFFSSQPDFPAVAGDMDEEFQQRAQRMGAARAKLWYWRESFRNACALTAREMYRTPAPTVGIAVGAFLAVNIVTGLYVFISFYPRSVGIFLGGFQYWDPTELVLNPSRRDLALLLSFIAPFAIGWIGGRLLPGREWALTLMFTFVSACITLLAAWHLLVTLRVVLAAPLRDFMIAVATLRLSGFWLGTLSIRQSRNKRAVVGRVS
jgi:hypothetical protein